MPEPELRFDEAEHRYWLGDLELPSVSAILKGQGLVDTKWFTDAGRERGQAVHVATKLFDLGQLDEQRVPPPIRGFLEGWKGFRHESGFRITAIEKPVYSATAKYAGTFDREAELKTFPWILDLKCGSKLGVYEIQTAAYAMANDAVPRKFYRRAAIYLTDTGRWSLDEHSNNNVDYAVWLSALRLYHWRKEHGLGTAGGNA